MIHHHKTLNISATSEEIWAVVGDYMHIDKFAPLITSVEALTDGPDGVGSKRRCHFDNGTSMVEQVTKWDENQALQLQLLELDPMPLHKANAEISLSKIDVNQTKVTWGMDYKVKYGILGWLLGQTMMKLMMGKIINANLQGLADKVRDNRKLAV